MIVFAYGFLAGLVWGVAACATMVGLGWTGPTSLAIVGWPVILVLEAIYRVRLSRKNKA